MSRQTTRQRHQSRLTVSENEQEMTAMPTENGQSSQMPPRRLREARTGSGGEANQQPLILRIIKWIALGLIALCVCAGTVLSKVTLVSITGRMFRLSRDSHLEDLTTPRSVLFIQLTFVLVIPEVISFVSCLVRGVIGKTTKSFPWPSRRALFLVSE